MARHIPGAPRGRSGPGDRAVHGHRAGHGKRRGAGRPAVARGPRAAPRARAPRAEPLPGPRDRHRGRRVPRHLRRAAFRDPLCHRDPRRRAHARARGQGRPAHRRMRGHGREAGRARRPHRRAGRGGGRPRSGARVHHGQGSRRGLRSALRRPRHADPQGGSRIRTPSHTATSPPWPRSPRRLREAPPSNPTFPPPADAAAHPAWSP